MQCSLKKILILSLAFITVSASAEDIDLFVNHDVDLEEKPRVLLIFDTSGSMAFSSLTGDDCGYKAGWIECSDSRMAAAKLAMIELIDDNEDIDFGLMRFNASDGGYILNGIGSSHASIKASIASLVAAGGTPLTETLWEAYLYITGQSIDWAEEVSQAQRDTSVEESHSSTYEQEVCGYVVKNNRWRYECSNQTFTETSYSYISPFSDSTAEAARCDNSVNIIYMTDGDPSNDTNSDSDISSEHNKYFGSYLSNSNKVYSSYLHQLAKIIHGTSLQEVDLYPSTSDIVETGRLYTIGFGSGMSYAGQNLLETAATYGGGENLPASTPDELSKSLNSAVSHINAVNDSFTSPSVASNNVDQTRSRDSIYFAMFYPETGTRWGGNLKKLKVSGNTIVDSDGNEALDDDGLIASSSKTFWLPDGSAADGNIVSQGGVNLSLTTTKVSDRKLYTENEGELVTFNSDLVSEILALPSNESTTLSINDINWARGVDVDDEDGDLDITDNRSDIFGDPLHSKPIAIDYGDDDIRILIGTNAGFIHMFKDQDTVDSKGNQLTDSVNESWAFIPSALFDIIKPLRAQTTGKEYGMDGPISVYFNNKNLNTGTATDGVIDASSGDEVWAFFSMRRGGRNIYALDITNPDAPKNLWSKPIEGGVDSKFKELGQTWSKPQLAYIKAFGEDPLLVFGGGYDTAKDTSRNNDTMGRDVFIVNAKTGALVWSLRTNTSFKGEHSIAANVSLLDSDYDGYTDRIYASDTGGDIWRIDMPGSDTSKFSFYKFAELATDKDRRFFYTPLVARTMFSKVTIKDDVTTRLDTPFDAIVIGSGNRSDPTNSETDDRLFMIRDENTTTKSYLTNAPQSISLDDLMDISDDPFGENLDDVEEFVKLEAKLGEFKGWKYKLTGGEKSLAEATVVGGVAYYTSFTPQSDSSVQNQCSLSGGSGSLYAFHLHYGTKVYDELKFTTSYDVPDTPQLYYGEGTSCEDSNNDGKCDNDPTVDVEEQSVFYLIGPGIKGEDAANPLQPVEIIGPDLTVVDGTIQLVNDEDSIGFGFKTQQTYIYKREENDEIKQQD
ncbi:pilin biogenesis protein [Pseudoalteromonas sp. MMG010]|uniref:PilC/PilY family type IV pilus protein n=1 Tax=Pseudoalteromonas sp. MMG010 TaxID=2822685 RepID=UPI001B39ED07|nr:PilC/PilY family type IV pilus protein [Pseudoalteromonas sp. MMG010]MBQ4833185.1 pilin biogenesis protein [Pseudoalteromonas sp. MMG010]